MLGGKSNEKGKKTTIGLISKKATLHVQHTFCTFLWRCFARLHGETSRNFLVCSCSLFVCLFVCFCHCRSFSPRWPLAFLIFSPPLQNFHVVLPIKKNVPFVFYLSFELSVALFPVELRWPAAYFLFFSVLLFLYIPKILAKIFTVLLKDLGKIIKDPNRLYWLKNSSVQKFARSPSKFLNGRICNGFV